MNELLTLKVESDVHEMIADEANRRRKAKEKNRRLFETARDVIVAGIKALKQQRKEAK